MYRISGGVHLDMGSLRLPHCVRTQPPKQLVDGGAQLPCQPYVAQPTKVATPLPSSTGSTVSMRRTTLR